MNKKLFVYRWASIINNESNRAIFWIGNPGARGSIRCTTSVPANQNEVDTINRELRELVARQNAITIRQVTAIDTNSDVQPQRLPPRRTLRALPEGGE